MYCTHIEEVTLNANISSFGYADANNHWEDSSCPFMLACALNLEQVKWSSVNYKASELDFIEDSNGARVLLGLDNK